MLRVGETSETIHQRAQINCMFREMKVVFVRGPDACFEF